VPQENSTLARVRAADEGPAPRWGRRVGATILLIVVVFGALGYLGVRSRTVATTASGYTVQVTYPQFARAGLDVPFRVHIHHPGGFPSELTLAISANYFRMFETQGFFPDASSSTGDGKFEYLTFTTPHGDDFVVDYDAYIQPAAQLGKPATVQVILDHRIVVQTHLHTWLWP
jgi:hypothetical protein